MIESIGYGMMAVGAVGACCGVARIVESFSYDKPKQKIPHTDTLFRGAKQCHNCRHSEISTVYPELACPVLGKHVEPHHKCDEWA